MNRAPGRAGRTVGPSVSFFSARGGALRVGPLALLAVFALSGCQETKPVDRFEKMVSGTLVQNGRVPERLVTLGLRDGKVARIVDGPPPEYWAADETLVGDVLTPGIIDAHGHPAGLGQSLRQLDLSGVQTYAAVLDQIGAAKPDDQGLIRGRGWDQNDWADVPAGGWPLNADLDARTAGHPAWLVRVDGHAAWANTALLTQAGINAQTPDPPGGRVVRDPSGAPTGVLVDAAMDLVKLPPITVEQRILDLLAAQEALLAAGIVGAHDMGADDTILAAWEAIDADGRLQIEAWVYVSPESRAAEALLASGPRHGRRLHVIGIKAFTDGALGSRGAWLTEPYSDEPGWTGLPLTTPEVLGPLALRCVDAGVHLAVHAIGDRAATVTLDAFALARRERPERGSVPLRLEHAQVVRPEDLARMASLNVVASAQPTHATSDMGWAEARLGSHRISWAYRWRSFKDAGVKLAFGSDFPIEAPAAGLGLWAATTRRSPDGKPEGGFNPDEILTLGEAVEAFTEGPRVAVGNPSPADDFVLLREGSAADLVVWRRETRHGAAWLEPTATLIAGTIPWRAAPSGTLTPSP